VTGSGFYKCDGQDSYRLIRSGEPLERTVHCCQGATGIRRRQPLTLSYPAAIQERSTTLRPSHPGLAAASV
jgi:hypothetical protein